MTDLQQELFALGAELEFPATPDVAARVRARIEAEPARARRRPARRTLAIALAVVAVAVAGVLAVPSARTAILRFLHLGGVTIERVETLPPARELPLTSGLGPPLTRAEAIRRAGFRPVLPRLESEPRFYADAGFLAVALERDGKPLLLSELLGDQFGFAKKAAQPPTRVASARVNGTFAFWITGGPHVVQYQRPDGTVRRRTIRIAGNVLIWVRGTLTLRLEGQISKAEAVELAGSLH